MKKKWVKLVVAGIAVLVVVAAVVIVVLCLNNDNKDDGKTTDPTTDPTQNTDTNQNNDTTPKDDTTQIDKTPLTFKEFLEMSPVEQQDYMNSYEDVMDFLEWYRVAEEKYKEENKNNGTEISGGEIDLGDFIN